MANPKPLAAVGYARVSTALQVEEGVSLAAQQERIREWCHRNGARLIGNHVDAGISGKRADNRPGLGEALDEVCRHGAALVVYSMSRLARSTRDTIAIVERLEKSGADLVSLSERIDTTSANGRMMFRMLAVLAEFERDLISERTRTALSYKRSRSERVSPTPYGSRLADDGRTLIPDPGELAALDLMKRLSSEGKTLRGIAAELDRLGIPTKQGRAWSHVVVARLLKANSPSAPAEAAAP